MGDKLSACRLKCVNFVVVLLGIGNRSSYSSSETSLMLDLSHPEDFISTAFSSCKLCCVK